MLTSSLLVTAISMSASSAPAWRSTVGREPRPWMVRISRRSPRLRRRSPSVSTTVMSLASLARCSARVPPTWPAPRMMIFKLSLLWGGRLPTDDVSIAWACGDLDQLGIIETVMAVRLGQQLPAMGLGEAEGPGYGQFAGTAGAGEEGGYHLGVLGRQGRTGGIEQHAADRQGWPQRIEQFALQLGQGEYFLGLEGQLDVRMAADHPGGRAWRVEQDALERLAVPPERGLRSEERR